MAKHDKAAPLSDAADRLGILDTANLRTVQERGLAPLSDALLTADNAIRLALHIAATVITAGHLDRYRPGAAALPTAPIAP